MYTPKDELAQPEGPSQVDNRRSRSSAKYSGAGYSENRRSAKVANQGSRTPVKHVVRDKGGAEPTASDLRLNKLIADYKAENERCTHKINDLKQRLKEQQD